MRESRRDCGGGGMVRHGGRGGSAWKGARGAGGGGRLLLVSDLGRGELDEADEEVSRLMAMQLRGMMPVVGWKHKNTSAPALKSLGPDGSARCSTQLLLPAYNASALRHGSFHQHPAQSSQDALLVIAMDREGKKKQ